MKIWIYGSKSNSWIYFYIYSGTSLAWTLWNYWTSMAQTSDNLNTFWQSLWVQASEVLNKNWKIYWSEQSFTGLGPEERCSSWGLRYKHSHKKHFYADKFYDSKPLPFYNIKDCYTINQTSFYYRPWLQVIMRMFHTNQEVHHFLITQFIFHLLVFVRFFSVPFQGISFSCSITFLYCFSEFSWYSIGFLIKVHVIVTDRYFFSGF
jgi:hypothetical protein